MQLRDAAFRLADRLRAVPAIALVAVLASFAFAPGIAHAQFQLGLQDPLLSEATPTALSEAAFGTVQQVAASTIRIPTPWEQVAPAGSAMPAGFNPSNPADPHYRWSGLDASVRNAASHHTQPLLEIDTAPAWAQPPGAPADITFYHDTWDPSVTQFRDFALALARRYSGNFPDPLHPGADLPRVKLYEIWNEENVRYELAAPNQVDEYRSLLNAAYAAIKSVHDDNVVAIGGLAPVGVPRFSTPYGIRQYSISPLKFAAALMCLRRVGTHFVATGKCPVRAHFDVLAMHPYSLASTPTKHAYDYDDVLVADMGKLATLLHAAETLHTATPNIKYGLWVTEWSWFSNPPDELIGDPDPVAARYVAWSMYEMWRAGTSLVTWLYIRYRPGTVTSSTQLVYGGALYTIGGQPTLKLIAFEFPVIAAVKRGRGLVWGRAPVKRQTQVFVQHEVGSRWRTIGTVRTASDGVFEFHFRARGNGRYRAQIKHGMVSLGYDSTPIPPKRTHALANAG